MSKIATPEKPTIERTPRGEAFGYVCVTKPDTKFKPQGEFKIRVAFDPEAGAPMYESLAARAEAKWKAAKAEFAKDPAKKKQLKGKELAEGGCGGYFDDDEGKYIFTFKSNASYVSKKKGTEGETINRTVPIFDAKGKRIAPEDIPLFGAGSIVRIGYTVSEYAMAAVGAGVSLRLESIQLLKPVAVTGGGDGGWGDESDGEEQSEEQGSMPPDEEEDF